MGVPVILYNCTCGDTPEVPGSTVVHSYEYDVVTTPNPNASTKQIAPGSSFLDARLNGKKVVAISFSNQEYGIGMFTKPLATGTLTMTNGSGWHAADDDNPADHIIVYWKNP